MAEEAVRCGQFSVTHRWLGGTLTNFVTIRNSVKRLKDIEAQLEDAESEGKDAAATASATASATDAAER